MLALIPGDMLIFFLDMTRKIVAHQPLNFAEWLFILLFVAYCVIFFWALYRWANADD
ncbi:MAG: hypothetical protein HDS35_00925 [Bacteroides sp.]|nr:hypothetical protein [Bacteroides sp.]